MHENQPFLIRSTDPITIERTNRDDTIEFRFEPPILLQPNMI